MSAVAPIIVRVANQERPSPGQETPFCHLESSYDYLHLLLETIESSREEVEAAIQSLPGPGAKRTEEALRLAALKLRQLSSHVAKSRSLMNDLRRVRSLLLEHSGPHANGSKR